MVFEGAFDEAVTDRASAAFDDIIAAQRAEGGAAGDHFGKAGANDRVWNAAQKLALHAPHVYAEYYAADTLALVSQAWLGPRYQVTLAGECRQSRWRPAGSAPRLPPRFRRCRPVGGTIRRTCTGCPRR